MKIVIDTNVLISSFLFSGFSAEVLDYCKQSHKIFLSNWIIDEFTEKMKNKFKIPDDKINYILILLNEFFTIINPEGKIPDICRDVDDNNILHLAEYINADYVITGDKDLIILEKYIETKIVTPREFYISEQKTK